MNDSSIQPTQSIDCLLLPGLHGTADLYAALIRHLNKRSAKKGLTFNYNALTYPQNIKQKYGSLVKWIQQEINIDSIETPKLLIIAESFSAPIALRLADANPDKVSAVVIAAGFCASPVNMTFGLLPLRPLFMVSPPRAALKHFLLGENVKKKKLNKLRSLLNSIPSKILSQRLRSVLTLEEANLPAISDTPLLLLQAQHDALIPWDIQNQLESHLPHAETRWFDSPHLLFQSRPKAAAKQIVKFISQLDKIIS